MATRARSTARVSTRRAGLKYTTNPKSRYQKLEKSHKEKMEKLYECLNQKQQEYMAYSHKAEKEKEEYLEYKAKAESTKKDIDKIFKKLNTSSNNNLRRKLGDRAYMSFNRKWKQHR